ncbi:hypothetical protein C0J52_15587 [Blattella germanica]|nr:hypothetical protein C0J52_15587 [Blattella germanica]
MSVPYLLITAYYLFQMISKLSSSSEDESETSTKGEIVADSMCNMQTATVLVEKSTNVQVGPHIQYHAPVTIKQYITVSGEETSSKNIQILIKEKFQNVNEGSDAKLEAEILTELPTKFTWYGPDCKIIEQGGSHSRYSIHTNNIRHDKVQNRLVINNVTKHDMGLYKVKIETEDNQQWNYFTLTVADYKPIQKDYVVICYVALWAYQRPGFAKYTVDDVDPTQCTHLIYAFANLNTSTSNINTLFYFTGSFIKMTSLKQKYPDLKVLLGVGGWEERDFKNYSIMAESPVKRREFVKSVTKFIKKYNFDGLDMHWQYPTEKNGVPADRENFVYLLKELREEFNKQRKGWILTTPLGVLPLTIKRSYIFPEISKYVDYMIALCYAYHGYWEGYTGPNAALYGLNENDEYNINYTVNTLIQLGALPEKLVLGLPLYGRNFLVFNPEHSNKFGGLTAGQGFEGRYVQEICIELETVNWTKTWDTVTHTPFMSHGNRFMSYDDKKSIAEKVEFAISKRLAGVSVWSLDQDDFRGHCDLAEGDEESQYPLMKTINRILYSASLQSSLSCDEN